MNPMTWLMVAAAGTIAVLTAVQTSERRADRVVAPAPSSHDSTLHRVIVHRDERVPKVFTGEIGADGQPISIACSTCHATKPPELKTARSADLDIFHQGLEMKHGELACLACHDERNYDGLKLATGEAIEFADRMRLCTQCHGPTARDYEHGAHGGMNGHWDLTRGDRFRLGCTDCHDPHAPAYPTMRRTFYTRDRGAESTTAKKETHHDG